MKTKTACLSVFLLLCVSVSGAWGETWYGTDFTGGALTPSDGDVLSGTFNGVTNFEINGNSTTVFVDPTVPLIINAEQILLEGILNGDGAGYAGAASGGDMGTGPRGGEGGADGEATNAGGGAGGGYGGPGGAGGGPPGQDAAEGGAVYGSETSPGEVLMGSGGGAAGDHNGVPDYPDSLGGPGGSGGGAISLFADYILLKPGAEISVDGSDGEVGTVVDDNPNAVSGGGGGAGGGILLSAGSEADMGIVIQASPSALSADGGDGAPLVRPANYDETDSAGQAGGGGGGGRIKLFGNVYYDGITEYGDFEDQWFLPGQGVGGGAITPLEGTNDVFSEHGEDPLEGSLGTKYADISLLSDEPPNPFDDPPIPDVPEPAGIVLLVLGTVGLGLTRRRRK